LDILENWLLSRLNEDFGESLILQQDGAPPFYLNAVPRFLNENMPQRWICRRSPKALPHRSHDLTPMDFSYGLHKRSINDHPLADSHQKVEDRIRQALESIDTDTLRKAWDEFRYRLDVVREPVEPTLDP
jgi:hypothetical protein